MIQNIKLNNFKRFKSLFLELKPITLISGENNTGKTSILESIFLLFDYATPEVFLKLQGFRGVERIVKTSESLWSPFFFDMDMSKTLSICAEDVTQGNSCNHKVSFAKSDKLQVIDIPEEIRKAMPLNESSNALKLSCDIKNKLYQGHYVINDDKIALVSTEKLPVERYVHYLGPHVWPTADMVANYFSKVELSGKKASLIRSLKLLDYEINDIMTLVINGMVKTYISFNSGKKFPIDIMGDGIQKLLYVSVILLSKPNCILLLDEVENGLHYSMHAKFWELIGNLAQQENCQIIATTHSYECIDGALNGVKNAKSLDDFEYVRLNNTSGQISPKIFYHETLEIALSSEMEVR